MFLFFVIGLSYCTILVIYIKIYFGNDSNQTRYNREFYNEYILGLLLFITNFLQWYNLPAFSSNHKFITSPDCVNEYKLSTSNKFYPKLHSVHRCSQIGFFSTI